MNLVKLCVGISAIEELQAHIDFRVEQKRARGLPTEQIHTTRMVPKRKASLLEGGSLYWVIKGNVQVRQILCDIRPFRDSEGIARCDLVMESRLIPTLWQPRRPFQGWRYLKARDAPADLNDGRGGKELPPQLQLELANLGLL